MNWTSDQRILGSLLMMFSLTMLLPAFVGLIYMDKNWILFIWSFGIILTIGLSLWYPVRKLKKELSLRDGFLIVASFWIVLGSAGSLPFYLSDIISMSFTDSVFESISGLTTTGATVLTDLDQLPHSILFYRHQLQWFGGMGIIVLAVAVLPMLGVGGMQLYRAETPGPIKNTKLTPRITKTAKALWYVYLSITILCAMSYFIAGMGAFDAICHAFSTVAIGGFSTHNESIGYFNSSAINLVAIVFMIMAGINFSLHFIAWKKLSIKQYLDDPEFRAYIFGLLIISFIVITSLSIFKTYDYWPDTLINGLFQSISIATTTGFTTAAYTNWPGALPVLLIFASFIGGCAGSTGGGIKVIRCLLILKQGTREIIRLLHPSAEIPVKLGKSAIPFRVVDAVWGFFSVYIIIFVLMLLAMMSTGLDQITAFSAVAATINNLGPGLGEVSANFSSLPNSAKWISIISMLLGRLEIFTLLVLISPSFWRH